MRAQVERVALSLYDKTTYLTRTAAGTSTVVMQYRPANSGADWKLASAVADDERCGWCDGGVV